MRYTHNLALMLEEVSRKDEGWRGKCLQILLYRTLADRLWTPFKVMCFNPFITLAVVAVIYIVFCVIYTPLWLVSLVLTQYGAYMVLIILINYLANVISRSIAFAGYNSSVQKQISSEFFRRIAQFLEGAALHTSEFSSTLLLGPSGQIPFSEMPPLDTQFEDIRQRTSTLPALTTHFRECLEFLGNNVLVNSDEYNMINVTVKSMSDQVDALNELMPLAEGYIRTLHSKMHASTRGGGGRRDFMNDVSAVTADPYLRGTPELFKAASHCLKVSKALKAAIDASKPAKATEDDGAILSKIKSVLSMSSGVEGCEKLVFPYMRCLLRQKFEVERLSIKGPNNNTIDAVIFPAAAIDRRRRQQQQQQSSSGTNSRSSTNGQQQQEQTTANEPSAKGLVLFCCPNAGFYELLSQCDFNASWVGFYLKLGFDVCMFNYRGYGLSTGTPRPYFVKEDACHLYVQLQISRRPMRIIVHGESIGGMVACHVASRYPVDALVCDRTFASLDATAARLLSPWAGYGLRYCTLWSTNVVRDYLACTCPKIVLQDPDDEIIQNLSSLKNGVASRIIMGDLCWKVIQEPTEYRYARYMDTEMPNRHREAEMLAATSDPSKPLSEAFIYHFYACLCDISKKAGKARFSNTSKSRRTVGNVTNLAALTTQQIASQPAQVTAAGDRGHGDTAASGGASPTGVQTNGQGLIEEMVPMGLRQRSDDSATTPTTAGCNQNHNEDGGGNARAVDPMDDEMAYLPTSRKEWLERFCNVDIQGDSELGAKPSSSRSATAGGDVGGSSMAMTSMPGGDSSSSSSSRSKVWVAVARVDGGSGQLLGQALGGGIEGVRAWICSLLVWRSPGSVGSAGSVGAAVSAPNAYKDSALPTGCTDLTAAARDLELLMDQLYPSDLQNDGVVQFMKQALSCLAARRGALAFHVPPLATRLRGATSFHTTSNSSSSSSSADGDGDGAAISTATTTTTTTTTTTVRRLLGYWHMARNYLSYNAFASIDQCADIGDHPCLTLTHDDTNTTTTGSSRNNDHFSYNSCHSVSDSSSNQQQTNQQQTGVLPYVGQIVSLHCGHNGWPSQAEISSLLDFFGNSGVL